MLDSTRRFIALSACYCATIMSVAAVATAYFSH